MFHQTDHSNAPFGTRMRRLVQRRNRTRTSRARASERPCVRSIRPEVLRVVERNVVRRTERRSTHDDVRCTAALTHSTGACGTGDPWMKSWVSNRQSHPKPFHVIASVSIPPYPRSARFGLGVSFPFSIRDPSTWVGVRIGFGVWSP